jgi:hypothetical protein
MKKTIFLLCFAALVTAARAERAWWDPRPSAPDLKVTVERQVRQRLGLTMTIDAVTHGWNEPVVFKGVTILDSKDRKRVSMREAELVSLTPLVFTLRDAVVHRPGWPDTVTLQVPVAEARVPIVRVLPQRTIHVTAPAGQLTGPRPTSFTAAHADIDATKDGVSEIRFGARAFGGRIAGALKRPESGGETPTLSITCNGLSVAAITGRARSEHVDVAFNGVLPWGLKDLAGSGRITIHGLSVDLTNEPQLVSMDRYTRDGQTGTRLIGSFIRNEKIRGYTDRMAAQADYYRELVLSLRRRHSLGTAGGPLSIYRGTATVSPFSGSRLSGRVTVNLVSQGLSGYLSRVSVGRATLHDVRLAGTVAHPRPIVNKNKVTLDGKPAPKVPSSKSQAMDAIVRSRPDKILREVFGSGLFR